MAAAELVHNFAAVASAHSHGDVTLPVLDAFDYFPNLWQLQSLGLAGPQCADIAFCVFLGLTFRSFLTLSLHDPLVQLSATPLHMYTRRVPCPTGSPC